MTLKCKMLTAEKLEVLVDRINRYIECNQNVFDIQIIQDFNFSVAFGASRPNRYCAVIKEDVVDK